MAVQAPTSGDTCNSFHLILPVEKLSGKGCQSTLLIWTYSSVGLGFIAASSYEHVHIHGTVQSAIVLPTYKLLPSSARAQPGSSHGARANQGPQTPALHPRPRPCR